MIVCTNYELWLKLKWKWGKCNVLLTIQFPNILGIVHPCWCEAGQQRESCHFLGCAAGTVRNFSCSVVFRKVPLSLSLVKWCSDTSVSSVLHVWLSSQKWGFATEAWLWLRLNIKNTNCLLHSSASKSYFSICSPEHSQTCLFCLYRACCSFRASRINWMWSQSCGSLSLCETSGQ